MPSHQKLSGQNCLFEFNSDVFKSQQKISAILCLAFLAKLNEKMYLKNLIDTNKDEQFLDSTIANSAKNLYKLD